MNIIASLILGNSTVCMAVYLCQNKERHQITDYWPFMTVIHWWLPSQRVSNTLPWCHNERDSVSNHQPHDCLLNRLFRRRSKKTSKLRVTGLCVGNSPGPVNSPHKWPVTRKMFPFNDVIMMESISMPICFHVLRVPNLRYLLHLSRSCFMQHHVRLLVCIIRRQFV